MKIKHQIVIYLIIIALAYIQFSNVLSYNYSLDDTEYTMQLNQINEWNDLEKISNLGFAISDYRPVATLSFALEKLFFGELDGKISHHINLIIYILISFLIFSNIKLLPEKYHSTTLAIFTSIFFIILPLHVSMVSNIKNRDGLLSCAFGLLFIYSLVSVFKTKNIFYKISYGTFSIISIFLSVYSKLDGLNFIVLLPILTLLLVEKINWKNILRFGLITIISYKTLNFILGYWTESKINVQGELPNDPLLFTENPLANNNDILTKLSFSIETFFEYTILFLKPYGHYFYFGYNTIPLNSIINTSVILKLIVLLFIFALAIYLYRSYRIISFGIVAFYSCLIYCSNFITPVAGIIADRYAFIASIGGVITISAIIIEVSSKLSNLRYLQYQFKKKSITKENQTKLLSFGILSILIIVYVPINIERSKNWENIFTLLKADMPYLENHSYEANRIATENYFFGAMNSGDEPTKEDYLRKSLYYAEKGNAIYDSTTKLTESTIITNMYLNEKDKAIEIAKKTIQKYEYSETAWAILSDYYYYKGDLDSTIYAYEQILNNGTEETDIYYRYTNTLRQIGKKNKAIHFCDSLIQTKSLGFIPYEAKGYVYLLERDSLNAVKNFELAFENGCTDMQLLDIIGNYWWDKDKVKWESMKKYISK